MRDSLRRLAGSWVHFEFAESMLVRGEPPLVEHAWHYDVETVNDIEKQNLVEFLDNLDARQGLSLQLLHQSLDLGHVLVQLHYWFLDLFIFRIPRFATFFSFRLTLGSAKISVSPSLIDFFHILGRSGPADG